MLQNSWPKWWGFSEVSSLLLSKLYSGFQRIWFDERLDFWQVVRQLCTKKSRENFPWPMYCQRVKFMAPLPKMQDPGLANGNKYDEKSVEPILCQPSIHFPRSVPQNAWGPAPSGADGTEARFWIFEKLMRWMCWWPKCCWFVSADVRCQSVPVRGNT